MDTIEGMRTFVAVVSERSFSGAANRLDKSPQLVSKYIAQLETRLGIRLLNRSTRRLSTTEAGQAYYERCQVLLADLDELESAVRDMAVRARGTLRINAPVSFGVLHLARAIAEYQRGQPEVSIDLTLNDRVVDIISEGYDLAIRIGSLQESALVARPLAPVRMVVCGAPDYLLARGIPAKPKDLEAHDCLGYAYWSEASHWHFERDGTVHSVNTGGRFCANNGDVLRAAALAGAGLILQPTFIVGDDIRAGRLRAVLADYKLKTLQVYAVYPHRQYLSAKVRTFVDFLAYYFGSPPYWDAPVF
ncbi:MAG: LysR family transcriptional regulator [Candidatus Competibacteraceae bacterium]|nr:LysR family transcriptional regulator [Candidatus Competibacteraceae bacterium]